MAASLEESSNRKKEIIDLCLAKFIEKGLFETSVKDLSQAAKLNPGALYFHFANKDEIVLACAEEAGIRMEGILVLPLMSCLDGSDQHMKDAAEKMEQVKPMMKFFAQVCTTERYRSALQPCIARMKQRHHEYAVEFAKKLGCNPKDVEPYLLGCVVLVSNWMIFEEDIYYQQPYELVMGAIRSLRDGTAASLES